MALAPEQAGIGIRRYFTTPDVHPYDQVAWDRRDARITNFRDGSVAFEQLDVEVPATWSLNATNILAQKYFRGTVGTPERETSLRQVVHRVADTITEWGVQGGYFVDDEEAEAFRAELKYLVVTQRAAFNSPVWFNIGVRGVPQQASACQPYDALVSTPDGLVPIGRLVEDDAVGAKVFDAHGLTTVVAVKHNGRKQVIRITTKAGHRLDVTPDHLVWKSRGEGAGEFVEAGQLRPGDALAHYETDLGEVGGLRLVEIRAVHALGEMDVYDIQTESGEYLSGNLRLHNCFILHVDDTMDSILNWYVEEGTIFKGGSGSGINLSGIRSSHERLKGGGTASGPVSFMRGADASAGTIKSGGKTRRAAKMVILNVDHPDLEEFIWCKAVEERKARVLRDAGFDMDLDGKDSHSTQYQNANNSVRVTDEFMQAVLDDADWHLRAVTTGEVVKTIKARELMRQISEAAWECADPGMQFDTTINRWHTAATTGRINASNPCSEYMHLDNSACNLASLNLLKFLGDDDRFDVDGFERAVEVVFTAQEILVGNADYPTEKIAETSRRFRQLGLGYANLGALLMALGLSYDSDAGRAWAGALTALMTGHAYLTSAKTAMRMGPFAGYSENREHMLRVLDMHRKETAKIDEELVPADLLAAAQESWDEANEVAAVYGVRNSQASVIAPTGCLVGGSLVATDQGLVRLRSLGDPDGPRWQDLDITVQTDDGPRPATKFFVNGAGPVVDVRTSRGYRIAGTTQHRIKVVTEDGQWVWRRFADLQPGDRVPLALDQVHGDPQPVALLGAVGAGKTTLITSELAYLVGLFMGRGTISGRGVEVSIPADPDSLERATNAAKATFGVSPDVTIGPLARLVLKGDALTRWWCANGFARLTGEQPGLVGTRSWVPDRILATNDPQVFASFADGVRAAAGVIDGTCRLDNARFAEDVQVLRLALGYSTARHESTISDVPSHHVVRNGQRFVLDTVVAAELGEEELTYDLSVPSNVTYVANGFVSHNTIGLLMDCDTTGLEPDLGLVKMKKLVGGGTMSIVNQTIPRALRRLGYSLDQVDEIVGYIDEHKSILGAPHLAPEHVAVFACSMGDNTIHYMGHIRMMAAIQPFISGALSKCVVGDTLVPTGAGLIRIGSLHAGEAPDTFRDEILEVASLDGPQKTDAFYYGGARSTLRTTLRSGHTITTTPNHRLLVGAPAGLDWKRVDELEPGDLVATRYGDELWSTMPARFDDFQPSRRYGSQKAVSVPTEMSEELAFLLGAYAAEGHTTSTVWTVGITNSVAAVRDRVVRAWESLFGVDARVVDDGVRCPMVVVASKTIVEFLRYLGCGSRASDKRVPDAVLRSPREMVLAFLQGLALDAYVSNGPTAKWAICLDSRGLLDDLQAILTNLGVTHGRISKYNREYDKTYDEVYTTGVSAQRLATLVRFFEPDKAARAEQLLARPFQIAHNTADIVPCVTPKDLYALVPYRQRNAAGRWLRTEFGFLHDRRTKFVSRYSLERVASIPGVVLPPHLRQILDDDLHFSPVVSVVGAGEQEVFDISVPATHAFVGNGIVNHNTVNMPEDVTVEEVEQLHIDAWRSGIKAVAIYRDNCKVAQPLSTVKKDAEKAGAGDTAGAVQDIVERIVERVVTVKEPVREKLPRNRTSRTFEFRVADCKGFVTVGEYADGRPGEIFMRVSKQGSTLAGIMDAFAISVSYGLQYGVPLRAYVETFTNMRFEPAGMTDDPDLRFASSLIDYIFRRLAVDYLSPAERAELNILTIGERSQPTLPGVEETVVETRQGTEMQPDPPSVESAMTLLDLAEAASAATIAAGGRHPDAPICMQCGVQMQRAGSCHACPSCGNTSGCS